MGRELVGNGLGMQPVLEFGDHDRHLVLHHAQEPRHNDRGALYSLSDHPNPTSFSNSEDVYANSAIPNIPGALQTCASTNFYYTANSPTDITNALLAMFEQAVSTAHVSN